MSAAMAGGQDKWIRSVKDNPAGKLVADPEGNRREWGRAAQEDTSRLLRKFNNDELANEQTDLVPNRCDIATQRRSAQRSATPTSPKH